MTNIEYFQGGAARSGINVPGAIIGGVAGAVVGNQIGSGGAVTRRRCWAASPARRSAARSASPARRPPAVYRVTMQTDQGALRTYDVPATGDLRVGDRVRVENGVIYRA